MTTSIDTQLDTARDVQQTSGRVRGPRRFLTALAVLIFALSVLRVAWYGDDWLITLRTALNAVNGNGVTFNVDERVAGYTHPLWLLVVWVLGGITGSWVYSAIIVSVVLAASAVALLLVRVRTVSAFGFVASVVILSNTVLTWSTGGLEGALGAFLVCLLVAARSGPGVGAVRAGSWGLLTALVILTRLDLLLLVAPLCGAVLWSQRRAPRTLAASVIGITMPLAAWFGFSWIYYGTWLPNTYLAKTNVDIPHSELVSQGLFYLSYSLRFDPLVWLPLVGMVIAVLITADRTASLLLTGVVVYLAYVVWVGGDFMAGRFLMVPVLVCLAAIVEASRGTVRRPRVWRWSFAAGSLVALVLAFGSSLVFRADTATAMPVERGVVDERAFWIVMAHTNIFEGFPAVSTPPAVPDMDARSMERYADGWARVVPAVPRATQVQYAGVGHSGMSTGPSVHVIDLCALTDRFLALQPFTPSAEPAKPGVEVLNSGPGWRIGHFGRDLPEGYVEAVMWNDPGRVTDPDLREQLRALWAEIRGSG